MKIRQNFLMRLAATLTLCAIFLNSNSFAQAPLSANQTWIPDCSNPANPIRQNLHSITSDNQGSPMLDGFVGSECRRDAVDRLFDPSFEMAPDGSDGNYLVFESRRHDVQMNSGNATVIPDSRRVFLRHIDASGVTLWEAPVGSGNDQEDLPHIAITNSGYVLVSYRSTTSVGVQIMVAEFDGTLGGFTGFSFIPGAPTAITSDAYSAIGEYSLSRDQTDGALVAFAANVPAGGREAYIKSQWIDNSGVHKWGANGRLTNNVLSPGWVFNPIIKWNPYESNAIDVSFGENPVGSSAVIKVQTYYFVAAVDSNFAAGAIALPGITIAINDEFYMTHCRNPLGAYGSQRIYLWDGTGGGGTNQVQIRGFGFSSLVTPLWATVPLSTNTNGSLPSGLTTVNVSAGQDDPIAIYMDRTAAINSYLNPVFTCKTRRINTSTGLPSWPAVQIAAAVNSQRAACSIYCDGTSIYAAVPDLHQEYISKQNISGGAATVLTVLHRCDPIDLLAPNTQTTEGDSYEAVSLGSTLLGVVNFEYGLSQLQSDYLAESFPNHPDRSFAAPVNNSSFRSQNTRLSFQAYAMTGTFASVLTTPKLLEYSGVQHAQHSATYQNLQAVVYENFTEDATSDIMLSYLDPAGSGNYFTVNVTNHLSPDYTFIRPKVGVLNFGGGSFAYVTYVRELYLGGSNYSGVWLSVIDLSTGSPVGVPILIDQTLLYRNARNFDLVFDPLANCFIAVFGTGFSPGFLPQILARRINPAGGLGWVANASVSLVVAQIEDVSACYNPDPFNSGAYVVWNENGGTTIQLNALRSSVGITGFGIQSHTSFQARKQPAVAADANSVMVVWADQQLIGPPTPMWRIYGCAHTNTGAVMPGWVASGNLISVPTTPYTSTPTTYEAFEPAVINSATNTYLTAFSEDADPFWTTFTTTSPRRIGMRSVNVSAALGAQQNLSFNQVLSPSNDLTNSMFGFMEVTPKLVQRTSPDVTGIYGPPLPYVLCAFQTLAYQKTGTAFHDFYAPELTNHSASQPVFAESNISARLLDPFGTQTFGQFCIASATDAQVLENIHFTDALGFTASYADYDNSDNHTADVKLVDLNSEIRTTTTFAPTVWNTTSPCGTAFPPGDPEGPFIVYNNAAMNMSIPTGAVTFTPSVGVPADWSTTIATGISPYSGDVNIVTWAPANEYCMPGSVSETIRVGDFLGAPGLAFTIDGGGSFKPASGASKNSDAFAVAVYPNPSSGQSKLDIQASRGTTIEVGLYDLLGRKMFVLPRYAVGEKTLSLPVSFSSLPEGTYILRVSNGDRIISKAITLIR